MNTQSCVEGAGHLQNFLNLKGFVAADDARLAEIFSSKIISDQEIYSNKLLAQVRDIIQSDDLSLTVVEASLLTDALRLQKLLKLDDSAVSSEMLVALEQELTCCSEIKPLFDQEKCKIHKKTQNLVTFIVNLYREAASNVETVPLVYQTIRDIFEMVLALMELSLSSEWPIEYICVVRNDFYHLANHATALTFAFRFASGKDSFLPFADYSLLFQKTADEVIESATTTHKQTLISLVSDLIETIKTLKDLENNNVINKIHNLLFNLQGRCFRVLSLRVYQDLMGSLFADFFERLYRSIMQFEDISRQESLNMETSFPLLLESVAPLMGQEDTKNDLSNLYPVIPSLKRFVLLVKLIQSSMAETLYMWETDYDNIRTEIPTGELIGFVRSMFQNTIMRADAISRIAAV